MTIARFFLLLPYADIISDWLSKLTSDTEKELENREGKPTKSNKVQAKKELSNGYRREKCKNGNDNPDNKREHNPSITVPCDIFVRPSNNCSLKNVTSIRELSSNGTLKPVNLEAGIDNSSRENGIAKEITKDVKQENANTSKELMTVNSKPCTPTKRAINETYVKQEIVPFVMKDIPSCVSSDENEG
ncbi:uncharacterized protein LOC144563825 isoform X1 [Carex rostrata]